MSQNQNFFGNILFTLDNNHIFFYLWVYQNGSVAQLVEQWTENPRVVGSIPIGTTKTPTKVGVFLFLLKKILSAKKKGGFYKKTAKTSLTEPA